MNIRKPGRRLGGVGLVALVALLSMGNDCEGIDAGGAFTSVSGTIVNQQFTSYEGSAEAYGGGSYLITIADAPGFGCGSTGSPGTAYLSLVVGPVSAAGSFSAADAVTFNSFDDGVLTPESATSGTVSIDTFDPQGEGLIGGNVQASGPSSEVSGSFTVEVCN